MPLNVGFRPWTNVQSKDMAEKTELGTCDVDARIRLKHHSGMGKPPLPPLVHTASKNASGGIYQLSSTAQPLSENDACDRAFSNKSLNIKDTIHNVEGGHFQGLPRKNSSSRECTDLQVHLTSPVSTAAKSNANHKHITKEFKFSKQQQVSVNVISSLQRKEVRNYVSVPFRESNSQDGHQGMKQNSCIADISLGQITPLGIRKSVFQVAAANTESSDGGTEKSFEVLSTDMGTSDLLSQLSLSCKVPASLKSISENSKPVLKMSMGEKTCNLVKKCHLSVEASREDFRSGKTIQTLNLDGDGIGQSASSPSSIVRRFPYEAFATDIIRKDQGEFIAEYYDVCGNKVKNEKRSYGVRKVFDQEVNSADWSPPGELDGNHNMQERMLGGIGPGIIQAGEAQILTSMHAGTNGSSQPYLMYLRRPREVLNDTKQDSHETIILQADRLARDPADDYFSGQVCRNDQCDETSIFTGACVPAKSTRSELSKRVGGLHNVGLRSLSLGKRSRNAFEGFSVSHSIDNAIGKSSQHSKSASFSQNIWLERWHCHNDKLNSAAACKDADHCMREISRSEIKHLKELCPDSRRVQASAAAIAIAGMAAMQSRSAQIRMKRPLRRWPT